jgi:hypothetical protein
LDDRVAGWRNRRRSILCKRCIFRERRSSPAAPVAVHLLPEQSGRDPQPQTGDTREYPSGSDNAEEIPQASREAPSVELNGQQPPRKGRRTDEPDKKAEVGRDVLDGRAAQTVELRDDCRAPCRFPV